MANDPHDNRIAAGDLALQVFVAEVVDRYGRQAVIAQVGSDGVSMYAVGVGGNLAPHAVGRCRQSQCQGCR